MLVGVPATGEVVDAGGVVAGLSCDCGTTTPFSPVLLVGSDGIFGICSFTAVFLPSLNSIPYSLTSAFLIKLLYPTVLFPILVPYH